MHITVIGVYKFKRSESRSMLTSYSILLKVSDRDIQYLNDQHPDQCQIKQPECILFGQPGSYLFTPFLTSIEMYNLNRIGADRVDLGKPKSILSVPYLSSFYQWIILS